MLQKSPVLNPSLENLSYILRHREWWPEGFSWDFRFVDRCGIGLCHKLWNLNPGDLNGHLQDRPESLERSRDFVRIFCNPSSDLSWWRRYIFRQQRDMKSVTPEMVADRIDAFLAKQRG
jgi:hypothetical protein